MSRIPTLGPAKMLRAVILVVAVSASISACGPKQQDKSSAGKEGSKAEATGRTGNRALGQTPGGG